MKEKIKILKYNQRLMTLFGVYSYQLTEPSNEFYQSFGAHYVAFCNIMFLMVSPTIFSYLNISHIDLVLQNVSLITGGIQAVGMFISVGINMKKVKMLHINLQRLVDEGNRN